jgi:NAD(P)-dependent dehydrogenase (short-subunit alcohol dehydrogenase family)
MSIPLVAIVTGAGSGIGRAVCERLADLGYRLTLVGRREPALQATLDWIAEHVGDPPAAMVVPADVADMVQAESVIDLTVQEWGRVDALVNNAGVLDSRPIERTDEDLLYRTFAANTFGPAYLVARAWPIMLRQRTGCIVNVTSMATVDPFPGLAVYAASKSALESLTRSIRAEGGDHGIRAFSVGPGAVETPMIRGLFSEAELPPDRTLDPAEVAEIIVTCVQGGLDERQGQTILVPSP